MNKIIKASTIDSVPFATFVNFSHTKMCCEEAGSVEHDYGLSKVQRNRIAKFGTTWRKIAASPFDLALGSANRVTPTVPQLAFRHLGVRWQKITREKDTI